jgi:hypothetical protein
MKTTLFALLIVGASNFICAQNEIAYLNVDIEKTTTKTVKEKLLVNESYFLSIKEDIVPQRVKKFQKAVAAYDIKQADIYSENWKSTYTVIFTENNNVIEAVYDQNGKIIACKESYEGISLPYILSKKILKDYPGWGFDQVECNIDYSYEQLPEITYKVVIKNGNKKKTISIDASDFM